VDLPVLVSDQGEPDIARLVVVLFPPWKSQTPDDGNFQFQDVVAVLGGDHEMDSKP
jgi:hypothetical protein